MILFCRLFVVFQLILGAFASAESIDPAIYRVPKNRCEQLLVEIRVTKIARMFRQDRVGLFAELYHRDRSFKSDTEPHNFPVADLFGEDMQIVIKDLLNAQDYFRLLGDERLQNLTAKMIDKAQSMLRSDFGYLTYFEFAGVTTFLFDSMIASRMLQTHDLPEFPKLREETIKKFRNAALTRMYGGIEKIRDRGAEAVEGYLRVGKLSSLIASRAILLGNGIPHYSIPTVSDMSRIDLIKATSAPLWIRRVTPTIEDVDSDPRTPSSNLSHDDSHAHALINEKVEEPRLPIKSSQSRVFNNDEELFKYIKEKTRITDVVIQNVLAITDKAHRFTFEVVLFSETHEAVYGSIENFAPGRTPEARLYVFLSKAEQRSLGAMNTIEVFKSIQELYLKAGGY